jgi:hypothetical protein
MEKANIHKTIDTNYKGGKVICKCGWEHPLGDGFNVYHIDNCPNCTPELKTRAQRKVTYWGGKNMTADIGENIYFVLSNGINIRYSFVGTSHTGLSMNKANTL